MSRGTENPIRSVVRPRDIDLGGFFVRLVVLLVLTYVFWITPGIDAITFAISFVIFFFLFLPPGRGVDVIPHPHINLATVTTLFEGEIVHRDSIGSVQTITPGAVNLMVAGRGIVHSERTGLRLRAAGHTVHGLQLWLALPEEAEEVEAAFHHYAAEELPRGSFHGVTLCVMIGGFLGLDSPVRTFSSALYAEAVFPAGGSLDLPDCGEERAVYPVYGSLETAGFVLPPHRLTFFADGCGVRLSAREESRVVLIGGGPLGKRHMWWNFVSSRKERIEKAKADWKSGAFGSVPGETDRHPLPDRDGFLDG